LVTLSAKDIGVRRKGNPGSTNITTKGNTNIADLEISDNAETQAEESAKCTAESPFCVLDQATPKKIKGSEVTVMEAEQATATWDVFLPPAEPM